MLEISQKKTPYNEEAEQYVLGGILNDNQSFENINEFLHEDHFYSEIHKKIYFFIKQFLSKSLVASPITMKSLFEKDEIFKEVEGHKYLYQISSIAMNSNNILDYAKIVYELATRRELIKIGKKITDTAYDPQNKLNADEQIEAGEQELFELASKNLSGSKMQTLSFTMLKSLQNIEYIKKNNDSILGISTGFDDLDHILSGLQSSDLIILAARPSMGKTALALNMAINSAQKLRRGEKTTVGFFSLEMSSEQLATRALSMISEVSSMKLRNGHFTMDEWENKIMPASKELQDLSFLIDDAPALSISALRTRARRMKRQHNLSVLYVDYLQLLRSSSRQADGNRVIEVSEVSQGLKAIAKELNIPVIALSQLSRAVEQREDKRPQLSDLRESGSIEQDADIVMFLYREAYYLKRKEPVDDNQERHNLWLNKVSAVDNLAQIIIAKQRNGPIGNVTLYYDDRTTKFKNYLDLSK